MEELLRKAKEAQQLAYAPYSNFRVGAALLTEDGQIFTGCNVENASFGLTNCAERTAIFKAVSEGSKNFTAMAVQGDTPDFCYPCGACRQVMGEFNPQMQVFLQNAQGEIKSMTVAQLMPGLFTSEDLYKGQEEKK